MAHLTKESKVPGAEKREPSVLAGNQPQQKHCFYFLIGDGWGKSPIWKENAFSGTTI